MKSNKNKWVVSATTAALVASAIVPVASAANFSDIANNDHKDAILALADAGIVSGFADGTFKPNAFVTRGNVTKLLGKWLVSEGYKIPEDFEKEARFTDLPVNYSDKELVQYAALVKDAKVFNGSNNQLMHTKEMTREQMALVLVRAINTVYGVDLVADYKEAKFESKMTDLDKATDITNREAITALEFAELTDVTTFNPKSSLTRGQFASFLNRTIVNLVKEEEVVLTVKEVTVKDATTLEVTLSDDTKHTVTLPTALEGNKETEVEFEIDGKKYSSKVTYVVLAVTSVTAENATSLTLTGTKLGELVADDITIENNKVKSFTASEDGKSATVTLENSLNADATTKVTVKGTDFEVVYKVVATGVTLTDGATYDDNTTKQFIKINVNGKEYTASELITAGYDVKFEAFENKSATTKLNLFKGKSNISSTGELYDDLVTEIKVPTEGKDVYVKVTVTKGSEVLTSPLAKVKIINKDLAANTITAATLYNITNSVEQYSTTLKTGETAEFSELEVKSGSSVDYYEEGFVVKSSDESIVSIDKKSNQLTAQGPGTATITVTFGGATYTKTITVKNAKREATSVKVNKTSVAVTESKSGEEPATVTAKVQLLDQYGDPMDFNDDSKKNEDGTLVGEELKAVSSDENVAFGTIGKPDGKKLEAEIVVTGVKKGSALLTFRDGANARLGTASLAVNVTENGAVAKYDISVDNSISDTDLEEIYDAVNNEKEAENKTDITKEQISTDATIDTQDDKYVKLRIKGLNSAGQEIDSKPKADSYKVTTNVSAKGVLAATYNADGFIVVEAGTKAGTATITVTNEEDGKVLKTFQIKVTDVGINVTGVEFKNIVAPTYATTLDFEDFLSYTEAGKGFDPAIKGLTLSKAVTQPIRLALTDGTDDVAKLVSVGDLYIDKNGNGKYDAGEIKVGSAQFGFAGTIGAFKPKSETEIETEIETEDQVTPNVVTGVKVTSEDDGTLIFKVLNSEDEVVASKALSINF